MKQINTPSKKSQGMTFIEVLVALVIMVTGILGAVAMQATAKKGSFDAMQRSLASSLAQDIIEKMRNNNASILALYSGTYGDNNATAQVCNVDNLCSPAQMVDNDLYSWEQALMGADVQNLGNNVGGLINGVGCLTVNGNSVTVVVTWQGRTEFTDASRAACGDAGASRRQVVVEAFIL